MQEDIVTNKDAELAEILKSTNQTKRATVPALEAMLYQPIKLLDHGFIRVIDYMGDDSAIVQAARVSYGKGTKMVSQDRGLIQYLMRHRHTTPFEMCDIKLHVKLPIFVARQWIRHRTASVNEYSGRYSILANEFYTPEPEHLAPQSKTNRQGRDHESLPAADAERVLAILTRDAETSYKDYIALMNEDETGKIINEDHVGLSRELARMNLSVNYYTEWYWKINLHNLFHFLALRADSHAQYEIRVYAEAILKIMEAWVPFAYEAFCEHRLHATSFSKSAKEVLKRMLAGEKVDAASSGLSKREWNEFLQSLNLEE